jgi:ATP-dependent helicase/nuclease subunit B
MSRLILVTGDDPHALLRAAAAPFCVSGRVNEPLPILALRQGGLRDAVYELAARSGCVGWLGDPILVFAELAEKFAGDLAPLDALERETLIDRILRETPLTTLGAPSLRATLVARFDRLFGDLAADGVGPNALAKGLDAAARDEWSRGRNVDIHAIYERYIAAIGALPPIAGAPRTEGRDGLAHAARAIRETPERVGLRLLRPLSGNASTRAVHVYGLGDLRRGWRLFLSALHESALIDHLHVYVPLSDQSAEAGALLEWLSAHADERRTVTRTRAISPGLRHLRDELFTLGGSRVAALREVRVVEAPDLTRELEHVAREVKRLLLEPPKDGARLEPHRIAVIAREARPALTRAADVLSRYGIPVHARLRHTVSDVPVIAAFLRLLRTAHEGWGVAGLSALSNSPYFAVDLDLRTLEQLASASRPRSFEAWSTAIDAAVEEEFEGDVFEAGRRLQRLAELDRSLAELRNTCTTLDGERTLAEWIELSMDALGGAWGRETKGILDLAARAERALDPTSPEPLREAVQLDSRALASAIELLERWRAALVLAPADARPIHSSAWADLLERKLADEIVTVRTGTPGGVQLLEALAADGRSFEHVFIVDAAAGRFPADPAPDALFSDAERETMFGAGLPFEPARLWFEREKTLFRGLLRAPARSLQVSYPYADADGAPRLAAAYVESVAACFASDVVTTIGASHLVPEAGVLYSSDEVLRAAASALSLDRIEGSTWTPAILGAAFGRDHAESIVAQLLHAVRVERTRAERRRVPTADDRAGATHDWNGRIADPALLAQLRDEFGDRVWSATQLESYGRCPFTFFGGYVLRARELADVDSNDPSALDRGSIVHDALAIVYTRLAERFPDDPLSVDNFADAQAILGLAIHEAVDRHGGSFLALPTMRAARERELVVALEAYLRWEMEQSAKLPRKPVAMELSFGVDGAAHPPVELRHDGRALKLRGKIDRIDAMLIAGAEQYRYVVDHKTGASTLEGVKELRPAGGLLQLELYLAALDQLLPGIALWGGTYQVISTLERKAPLDRCSLRKSGVSELGNDTQQRADETIRSAAQVALSIVDRILAGEFPARTPGKVKCLSYCAYRDVCREDRLQV